VSEKKGLSLFIKNSIRACCKKEMDRDRRREIEGQREGEGGGGWGRGGAQWQSGKAERGKRYVSFI
jgi:hypothetical protein